jgi:hypothetical protein
MSRVKLSRNKDTVKKPGMRARLKERGSELADLGRTAVQQPRDVPQKVGGMLGTSVRKMYVARGGGFYACGFVITFVLLEARTLADDLFSSSGIGGFIGSQLLQWLFRFALDSLGNTLQALIWPVYVISWTPPVGVLVLAAAYFLFGKFLKEPLGRWLFGEQAMDEAADETLD